MKIHISRIAQLPVPVRLGYFILTLLLLWLPIAAPMYLFVRDTNLVNIVTIAALYIEFIFLAKLWGSRVYNQPRIINHYGLEFTQRNGIDLLFGLAVGLLSIGILFSLQGWLGWLTCDRQ
ncbi:MAG: CPBP family intramembrane metalloprotease, partial [Calothrix sp. SM1_7_51]|nr:CPBP family intramembrane metalloprotease [Calothrix sp. SM1_7_51]